MARCFLSFTVHDKCVMPSGHSNCYSRQRCLPLCFFQRFTNTSTMTVLTGGSQYVYHGEDLPTKTPIEKHAEPRWGLEYSGSTTFDLFFGKIFAFLFDFLFQATHTLPLRGTFPMASHRNLESVFFRMPTFSGMFLVLTLRLVTFSKTTEIWISKIAFQQVHKIKARF